MVKKAVVWALVFSMFLMPTLAMAVEERVISGEDLTAIFGEDTAAESGQTVQLAVLTDTEMKETEGAWWSWASAGWGAVGGGVSYATSTWASRSKWSWSSFAGSVAGGAVNGIFRNPGVAAIVGGGFGGVVSGWASRSRR